MRGLILCNDFPPLNSVGAQRPYSWFTHFKKFGVEPTVITKSWAGDVAYPEDMLKKAGPQQVLVENNEQGRIIRVPIKMILPEKMLVKYGVNGYRVVRKMLTLFYKMFAFLSLRFDKHAGIYKAAEKLLNEEKFDVIIITGEPFLLFKYGYHLSRKFGIPWIADYRDGWKLNHVTGHQPGLLNRILNWWEFQFEKKYIKSCTFITTIDPLLAKNLDGLHHKPVEVIFNGFDGFYQSKNVATSTKQLVLTHTGTLTPGQRVEFLLQAVKELHKEGKITPADLVVRFIGIEYFREQCSRILNYDGDVKPYIVTTPRLSREQALEQNASSDFLVSLTEKVYKAIFAKTYDYLSVKKPILVTPDDESILSAFVRKVNGGYVFTTVEELKQFLLESIQQKRRGELNSEMKINVEAALFYTREKQAATFAEILKRRISAH